MSESFQVGGIFMEQQEGDNLLLVEAYGDGGFRFLGRRVEGSVLLTTEDVYPIDAETSSDLTVDHFQRLDEGGNRPEILLIGTGSKMNLLSAELRKTLQSSGIGFELMDTGAAARTFNVLRMEDRQVAALMIQIP